MYSVDFPCKPGSDWWYVSPETHEVVCEEGGIHGFAIHDGKIYALDSCFTAVEIHTKMCCFSREEAEAFRK